MWGMACWRPILAGRPSQTHQCCFSRGSADPLALRNTFVAEPACTGTMGCQAGRLRISNDQLYTLHLETESVRMIVAPHIPHKHAENALHLARQLGLVWQRTRDGAAGIPALVAVPHCGHCRPHHPEIFRLPEGP
jgi:hypothetical protein